MEARPDIDSLCCSNEGCKYFQQRRKDNLHVCKTDGHARIRYLRRSHCGYGSKDTFLNWTESLRVSMRNFGALAMHHQLTSSSLRFRLKRLDGLFSRFINVKYLIHSYQLKEISDRFR